MNHLTNVARELTGKFLLILIFCAAFSFSTAPAAAQLLMDESKLGNRVEKFTTISLPVRNNRCLWIKDKVYSAADLQELLKRDYCKDEVFEDNIDFARQTVIGWKAGGDCHMRIGLRLFRNDSYRKVTLIVDNTYGGCRAGGLRSGLIALDKLPDNYQVTIIENGIDRIHYSDDKTAIGFIKRTSTWTTDGKLAEYKDSDDLQREFSIAKAEKAKPVVPFTSQFPGEIELPILRRARSRAYACREDAGGVYTAERFEKVKAEHYCEEARLLGVDMAKETVLGVTAKGDCHVRVETIVSRNDAAKKYFVRVNTIQGNCAAVGEYREWIVVEKFRPDYQVEWLNRETGEDGSVIQNTANPQTQNNTVVKAAGPVATPVAMEEFKPDGCFGTLGRNQFVFRTREEFLAGIRKDASNEFCRKKFDGKINFDTHSVIGIQLSSNYCNRPPGLTYAADHQVAAKTFTLNIRYHETKQMCARIGYFDIWLIVPKIPADHEVKFDVKTLEVDASQ